MSDWLRQMPSSRTELGCTTCWVTCGSGRRLSSPSRRNNECVRALLAHSRQPLSRPLPVSSGVQHCSHYRFILHPSSPTARRPLDSVGASWRIISRLRRRLVQPPGKRAGVSGCLSCSPRFHALVNTWGALTGDGEHSHGQHRRLFR